MEVSLVPGSHFETIQGPTKDPVWQKRHVLKTKDVALNPLLRECHGYLEALCEESGTDQIYLLYHRSCAYAKGQLGIHFFPKEKNLFQFSDRQK